MSGERHAILIASSRYPEEPKLSDLRCPENDVDGLNQVLEKKGEFDSIKILKNKSSGEVLVELNKLLRSTNKNDLILIYFSGHGKLNIAGTLHLTTINTSFDALEATSISLDAIRSYIDVTKSQKIVILLDCCFSGAVGKTFVRSSLDDQLGLMAKGKGLYIMTASTGIEVAKEKEDDEYGIFTKYLIKGINGNADSNNDGFVDVHELYQFVHPLVIQEGRHEPMEFAFHSRGDLIISRLGQRLSTSGKRFPTIESKPASPDLELRITQGRNENTLSFMLHSTNDEVGYHWKPMGETFLVREPQSFLEHEFQQLDEFSRKSVEHLPNEMQKLGINVLASLGEELFESLLPERLQYEYWRRIRPLKEDGVIQSFMITSDEPWIPWELMKPYRYDDETNEEETDGFWAEEFQLSRWLGERVPKDEIVIRSAQVVAPEIDLHFVFQEIKYIDSLKTMGINVEKPLQSKQEVIERASDGGIEILHFVAPSSFNPEDPNLSSILLKDGELTPNDLNTYKTKGLKRSKPLIFLNTCYAGRIGTGLTGLSGWAEKFVNNIGVSAFIGPLWEINAQLSAEFAIKFYDELQIGKTLGEAFLSARLAIKERQPANPTWLAYTLYGNPNARVIFDSNHSK